MKEKFVFIKTRAEAHKAIEGAYQGCYFSDDFMNSKDFAYSLYRKDINADNEYPSFKCVYYGQVNDRMHTVTIFNDFEASEKCATDAMRKYLTLKYGEAYIDALSNHYSEPLKKLLQERDKQEQE